MKYTYPTLIEPIYDGKQTTVKEYKVVGQDSSFPNPLFYGSYNECLKWQQDNCNVSTETKTEIKNQDIEQLILLLEQEAMISDELANLHAPHELYSQYERGKAKGFRCSIDVIKQLYLSSGCNYDGDYKADACAFVNKDCTKCNYKKSD